MELFEELGIIRGMGKALYRKYRSKSLSEVIGQKHITDILDSALKQGKISHAYLFTGPRGVGKTSVARIMAHEINGFEYKGEDQQLDIIEIDAASNNGVDDIRNLREKVQILPVKGKKKVYIIDEVHMLSKPAFNALLKTLEEPPEHVVFILATTDAHKLPTTIISRSQQFVFKLVKMKDVVAHLRFIAESEKILIDDAALEVIAKKGGGSFRDSISLLDQVSSMAHGEKITKKMLEKALGLASDELVGQLIDSYKKGDLGAITKDLRGLEEMGIRPETVADQIIRRAIDSDEVDGELLELVDKLTEVGRASRPEIKLLLALSGRREQVKNVATMATAPREVVIVKEVAKKTATKEGKKPDVVKKEVVKKAEKDEATKVEAVEEEFSGEKVELNWDDILESIKTKMPMHYQFLEKSDHEIEGGNLTIYARNKIGKTKLSGVKFIEVLNKELAKTTIGALNVVVLAESKAPDDKLTAEVAEIMGGGEEVKLDE